MNHSLTHFFYFIRKNILRKESRPGNFKRLLLAALLTQSIIFARPFVPGNLDEVLLLKTLFNLRGEVSPPDNLAIVSIDDNTYKELALSPRKPIPREVVGKALQTIQEDKPTLLILDLYSPKEEDELEGTKAVIKALEMGPSSIASAPINHKDDPINLFLSDPSIVEAATYEIPMAVGLSANYAVYISRDPTNQNQHSLEETIPLFKPLLKQVESTLKVPEPNSIINYYGPPNTIRSFSLWELFSQERLIPKGFFKDKVVVVGFKSELKGRGHSDKEVLGVPIWNKTSGYEMYGVEIHANIAGNLMDGNWIRRLPIHLEAMAMFLLLFILIKGIISYQPKWALVYMLIYLGTWFMASFIAFSHYGYFIPGIFLALLCSPIIFGGASCVVATLALKELKNIKKTFGV